MSEETLSHYGVLGMKWGVRKKPESSGGSGLRSAEEKKKIGEEINADVFKKERAKAAKAAEKERKKQEAEAKKAAKKAASDAKKAAASKKRSDNKAERAKNAAERARKKLENQKLREARKAEAERKKKQKEAERAEKKRKAEEKKAAKEAEKKQKELEKQKVPKGGITNAMRKEAPRLLSSTDLIEQNKRLNLEKQNYELKQKLKEYESQNRSVLSKTAELFADEARKNLTKYAAKTATNMLTAALESKLTGSEYEGVAKMAKDSFNLEALLKNSVEKKKKK
nr:MAG TPA: actin related protein 1 [Caudoviricetes sp.]